MKGKKFIGYVILLYVIGIFAIALILSNTRYLFSFPEVSSSGSTPIFANVQDVKKKKKIFFDYFSEIVNEQNARLLDQREALLTVRENFSKHGEIKGRSKRLLNYLRSEFRVSEEATNEEAIDTLLVRVNTIPRSLALVQAANESAWGTSRFAVTANNYFGEWCFSEGCGIVPENRNPGAIHEVEKFDSATESVASYFKNLNTHNAYSELRKLRNSAIENNQPVTGYLLAAGLGKYSERGEDYIEEIRTMIRINDLE